MGDNKTEKGRIEIIFLSDNTISFKVTNLTPLEVIGALTFYKDERLIEAFKKEKQPKKK